MLPRAAHGTHAELAARLAMLPPPPREQGRVRLVVARPDVDVRQVLSRCRLTPELGLDGDRWSRLDRREETQVTAMRADVASVFANGQSLDLFGDNLLVDLDLSPANAPIGALLRVGSALCAVTPKPHRGCAKFAARFGRAALELTEAEAFRAMCLRGLHLRVVEAGEVAPGDAIEVVERPGDGA